MTDASSTKTLTPRAFFQRLLVREDGRIMRYVLGVQLAVHCAGPYFTPFILRKLELSYASFMLLTAALFAGKIMIYPLCARVLARDGAKRLLWIGGVGMVLLPVPWMVSADFTWLLIAQLFAGMAWGTFETATFFLYLKTVPNDERAAMMSMFNVCNAVAMVAGASLGGLFLAALGTSKIAYIALFGVSTLLRMSTLLLLRRIEPTPAHHLVPVAFALVKPAFEIRTLSRRVASFPRQVQRVTVRQRARRRFSEARVASELL